MHDYIFNLRSSFCVLSRNIFVTNDRPRSLKMTFLIFEIAFSKFNARCQFIIKKKQRGIVKINRNLASLYLIKKIFLSVIYFLRLQMYEALAGIFLFMQSFHLTAKASKLSINNFCQRVLMFVRPA